MIGEETQVNVAAQEAYAVNETGALNSAVFTGEEAKRPEPPLAT